MAIGSTPALGFLVRNVAALGLFLTFGGVCLTLDMGVGRESGRVLLRLRESADQTLPCRHQDRMVRVRVGFASVILCKSWLTEPVSYLSPTRFSHDVITRENASFFDDHKWSKVVESGPKSVVASCDRVLR